MSRYRAFFSPYFTSAEFQDSHERKVEKAIEDKCKTVLCFINKIWKHDSIPTEREVRLKEAIEKIVTEDKELLDRLKD